ncbi:hypothetical protein KEJ27_00295 [Candidatus Bathyarchaeota archaeon]|nr:hypothetical protein [Candidatus Bathyarchaeota archaeon]MBS7612827.1 hypothetical protein [Candidatus Bathyarchaeota archaeon]MBS7617161.1 hypothetical protein [Candidatus Bathyarchaeota archaeon]
MSSQETRVFEVFAALTAVLLTIILAIFSTNLARFLASIEYTPPLTLDKYPFFIWTYRGLDTLTQVFLLLATTLGVVALLREDEGPGVEEESVIEGEEG